MGGRRLGPLSREIAVMLCGVLSMLLLHLCREVKGVWSFWEKEIEKGKGIGAGRAKTQIRHHILEACWSLRLQKDRGETSDRNGSFS